MPFYIVDDSKCALFMLRNFFEFSIFLLFEANHDVGLGTTKPNTWDHLFFIKNKREEIKFACLLKNVFLH